MKHAFENLSDTPCPICLKLAEDDIIQWQAVMPLPKFPARLRTNGQKCCRDCNATETTIAMGIGQHPDFGPARLTVANERIEGLTMPLGLMNHMGLCSMGYIAPCSSEDLDKHLKWLKRHQIGEQYKAPNQLPIWSDHENKI